MTPEKRKWLGELLQRFFAEAGDADTDKVYLEERTAWRAKRDAPIARPKALIDVKRNSRYDRNAITQDIIRYNNLGWGPEHIIARVQDDCEKAGLNAPDRRTVRRWFKESTGKNP